MLITKIKFTSDEKLAITYSDGKFQFSSLIACDANGLGRIRQLVEDAGINLYSSHWMIQWYNDNRIIQWLVRDCILPDFKLQWRPAFEVINELPGKRVKFNSNLIALLAKAKKSAES